MVDKVDLVRIFAENSTRIPDKLIDERSNMNMTKSITEYLHQRASS
jgi:hypothetical protein